MNLFLPYPDDLIQNARTIDDKRLNKQVVEAYQVGVVVLKRMRDPESKVAWMNHPASRFVYNNGKPKFPWLQNYIEACDAEWRARRFHRSQEFLEKIATLFEDANEFQREFSHAPVIAFVGGGLEVIDHDDNGSAIVGTAYRALLQWKWEQDAKAGRPPKWAKTFDAMPLE